MNCGEFVRGLKSWLDRRWADAGQEPPAALAEHAAGCRACARRLAAARLLAEGSGLRKAAPAALVSRVLEGLPRTQARPASTRWRWAAVPAAALLAAALSFGLTTRLRRPAGEETVVVRFVLEAPQAGRVSVVGDWNNWNPDKDRLRDEDGDGPWEVTLHLQKGQEARYQFLVDGERWMADPRAPLQLDDGFGGITSVLQI